MDRMLHGTCLRHVGLRDEYDLDFLYMKVTAYHVTPQEYVLV